MKIGVVLPIAEGETKETPRYREIRALGLLAERSGFDSIWIYDHLLYRRPDHPTSGIWECWTLMCALAEATERVQIGSIVLCSPFRNPALLAKMADTLDEVSDGRLILGVGAGWNEPEFTAFGYPFDHLVDRFEEALKIIHPLLKTGKVDFRGTYSSANDGELRPRGPRKDGPPLLVASFKPRMLRLTARYADMWNTAWLGNADKLAPRIEALHAACDEVGRPRNEIEITVGLNVSYPDPGDAPSEPVDPTKVLTGTAEEMAAEFKRYEAMGVGHLICGVDPNTEAGISRFAEAVAAYRGIAG
jgi:alkanesulfonate monooxygenase SsuD/methylene tetrahydromethanopterin reductase-like flavin-dependent oxidoreductase (luciferase family)